MADMPRHDIDQRRAGFTLIELLVVIAVIAILAGLLLPTLAKAKGKALTADCLSRKHQLSLAWTMYAHDNNDSLPWNRSEDAVDVSSIEEVPVFDAAYAWINNWMVWRLDWRTTNTVLTTRPDLAPLTPYMGNSIKPYKCPEDKFLSPEQRAAGWKERLRSVSMNQFMGMVASRTSGDGPGYYTAYRKLTDMKGKSPSSLWVIMDEHPDTIQSPRFLIWKFEEVHYGGLPASYHNGGATMFFADGHAGYRRWLVPDTKPPVRYKKRNPYTPANQDRRDFDWIREHATELRE